MTILFTKDEQKWLTIQGEGEYRLTYKNDAPKEIAASIAEKISAHKKWLKESTQ